VTATNVTKVCAPCFNLPERICRRRRLFSTTIVRADYLFAATKGGFGHDRIVCCKSSAAAGAGEHQAVFVEIRLEKRTEGTG